MNRLVRGPPRFVRGTILMGGWESPIVSEKKAEILYVVPMVRRFCPICGKAAYSLSGEHPQCAMSRGDLASKARQKKRNERRRASLAHT
jgi:hypothetical protein